MMCFDSGMLEKAEPIMADDMIVYSENPRESKEFSKMADYKMSILYTGDP